MKSEKPANRNRPQALTIDIGELAAALGVSRSMAYSLDRAGHLPAPLALPTTHRRWSRDAVAEWVRLGCPKPTAVDSADASRN